MSEQEQQLDLYTEMSAIADAPEDEKMNRARDVIRRVSALPAAARLEWRDAIRKVLPKLTKLDFDTIVREERKAQKEKAKAAAAERHRQEAAERVDAAMASGRLLPSPADPMAVARALTEHLPHTDDTPHLAWWRGDFYRWCDSRWDIQRDATIDQWLYLQTENAVYDNGDDVKRWAPTTGKIANLRDAIGSAVLARPWEEDDERCVAVTNGVVAPSTRRLEPHSPRRFNLTSLPFAYDPRATCPRWLAFLAQVLPDDGEARQFLQEWTGYLISGRTDLQKMAHLYGARRSGKGTIARITEALLGPDAVAAPSLSSLAGTFGEQPLIGKSLAVLSDVNWNFREVGEAVEVLKKISGEDSRDVNRKNRETWHGKLGVRFMIIGNDEPKFNDASGALAGRMIHIRFRTSFYGKEDPNLTRNLMEELPGILNWALDGLDRLTRRGRLLQPASSIAADREIRRNTSPVDGFIDDRAVLDPQAKPILLDDLYAAFREWCAEEEGRDRVGHKSVFARDLRSSGNGTIDVRREKVNGERKQWVYGLAPQESDSFAAKNKWLGGGA
ncbi:phage/plasmid primase, P4 family [Micromonospora sp. NPDC049891]|uniref:DNA primase family protein n=1 Tax=Micromonospora sp. NPDC049891 TaxID=3155655 RepID=UPI00340BFD1D